MKTLVCALAALAATMIAIRADGGAVVANEVVGTVRLTVFADPAVLRAGPVDFSVLVQDARTDEPIGNADIGFRLVKSSSDSRIPAKAWVSPCCRFPSAVRGIIPASHDAAQNKLLQAATIILPTAGHYELMTSVTTASGSATIPIQLRAFDPASPLGTFWPFLALPPVAIGLFALHGRIRR